jgi:predicted secreted Zn-dependent protease
MQAPASIAHRHPGPYRQVRAPADDDPGVCGGQLRIAGRPAAVATAIRSADPATQGRLIGQLQRQVGNELVGQLLAMTSQAGTGPAAPSVQRWPVSLPAATSDCAVVVNWINAHSPYRQSSGWARTRPEFGWGGDYAYAGSGDSLTVSVVNPTVTLNTVVDMPTWTPTNPSMSRAWTAMWADLRRHETRHEDVATTWKDTLLSRLTSLSLPIARQADGPAAVRRAWAGWLAEHQADQTALDPFTAMLDCSGGSDESVAADSGDQTESAVAAGDAGDDDSSTA